MDLTLAVQDGVVALVVGACLAYAAWTLGPAALRRRAAAALLCVPGWPAPLAARLRRLAAAPSGCGCDGCDRRAPVSRQAPGAERVAQPVVFHRRSSGR